MKGVGRFLYVACLPVVAALAGAGGEAMPKTAPRLWCPNPLIPVLKEVSYADRTDSGAVRLVTAKNGAASGQAVLLTDSPVRIVRATVTDLRLKGGDAAIPSSAVAVRYALATVAQTDRLKQFPGIRKLTQFDALSPTPGEAGTVQPVWITVAVPVTAAAGEYEGTLTVEPEGGAPLRVSIRLTVADWALPSPQEFTSHAGFIQSPDSVALQYQVPLWSDRHFELIGRSFEHLAIVGNKTIYIPLLAHAHFGNEETMVRWIAPRGAVDRRASASQPTSFPADTAYTHDFRVFERYLDAYEKAIGRPPIVCLYVWDYSSGGYWWGNPKQATGLVPARVTRLDPATGRTELMHGPAHGTPESEAFWKPVLDGIRERLLKRGYSESNILLGIGGDKRPDKPTVEMFQRIAPYARWVSNSHGKILEFYGVKVGYVAHVWGVGVVTPPEKQRKYGWQLPIPVTVFPRYGGGIFVIHPPLYLDSPLATQRMIWEGTTMAGMIGVGRCGADFWPVLPGARGVKARLLGRYPDATWGQLSVTNATAEVLYPGPDGALGTIRLEMMREGIHEAEARIAIERALVDKDRRAKLGDERAARIQALLDERVRAYLAAFGDLKTVYQTAPEFAAGPWQDRAAALFAAAGEVAKAAVTAGRGR